MDDIKTLLIDLWCFWDTGCHICINGGAGSDHPFTFIGLPKVQRPVHGPGRMSHNSVECPVYKVYRALLKEGVFTGKEWCPPNSDYRRRHTVLTDYER